jgi:PQQ-like domain
MRQWAISAPGQWVIHALLTLVSETMTMSANFEKAIRAALLCAVLAPLALNAQNVLTWHNDVSRTGQDLTETILTLTNVNSTQFGKRFALSTDGPIYTQPLYVAGVSVANQGTHNVVYVATENDSVYAFDALANPTTPLWQVSLLAGGATAVPCAVTGYCEITPTIGITGTPVIDITSNTLYVVAFSTLGGNYYQYLHALDITSGAEKFGGPVLIQASVPGNGTGSVGGTITFNALIQNQRSALLESNGVIYISWASFGDLNEYHGWVMGYNASTLAQQTVFIDTPNGSQGGIWQAAGGPSADSDGNIYLQTGNGTFDANTTGDIDYGDSFLKFTTTGGLAVADYFSPDNELTLDDDDTDLGSSAGLILPTQSGSYPDEITGAGKQGIIYLVNRNDMGKFNSGSNDVIQQITGASGGYYSSPAYFDDAVYYSGEADNLTRFTLTKGKLSKSPVSKSPTKLSAGGTPSISANGKSNAIVWVIDAPPTKGSTGVLHAYKASNVAKELYNSQQKASRDTLGSGVRFSVPTIANGNVYVGTKSGTTYSLFIFGLLN